MWLLEDQEAPDYVVIARFRTGRCRKAVEDLFYQYVRKLEEMGGTDHQSVFLDGTKLESRAGRYTFVWRKREEKALGKVKEQVLESTGCTSAEELHAWLEESAQNISFIHKSGRRKSPEQKEWERWEKYECSLAAVGKNRNSCSKTGQDATLWYRCDSCDGCHCRSQCRRAKDPAKPKELVLKRPSGKSGL